MIQLYFIHPHGAIQEATAVDGQTLLSAARDSGVDGFTAECGGNGTCGTCHDSVAAKAHMTENGGAFDVAGGKALTPSSATEACAVCHGPGRAEDTAKAHAE